MSNYFFNGGRAGFNWPTPPSRLVFSGGSDSLIERPLDVAAFDDVLPLNTKGLSALGMVERFVDAAEGGAA